MTKPHHMRPPGRPMRHPDGLKASMMPTQHLCSQSTLPKDLENLARVQASRPLKPPSRRPR